MAGALWLAGCEDRPGEMESIPGKGVQRECCRFVLFCVEGEPCHPGRREAAIRDGVRRGATSRKSRRDCPGDGRALRSGLTCLPDRR